MKRYFVSISVIPASLANAQVDYFDNRFKANTRDVCEWRIKADRLAGFALNLNSQNCLLRCWPWVSWYIRNRFEINDYSKIRREEPTESDKIWVCLAAEWVATLSRLSRKTEIVKASLRRKRNRGKAWLLRMQMPDHCQVDGRWRFSRMVNPKNVSTKSSF